LISLNFTSGKLEYREQYICIDNSCCPHIVSETEIPNQWQFSFLNKKLLIDDNSEEYHHEITKGYLVYRKANRKQILMSAFSHPASFIEILKDFIKRKIK
jgi:hypothetical protein